MTTKWIKISLTILALLIVGFWSINYKQKSQAIQINGYKLFAKLETLKEMHHNINDEILKSTLFQLYNNDVLNKKVKQLNELIEKIQKSEIYTTSNYPKTKVILQEILEHQKRCNQAIETFKRENGKIKNSFSFVTSSLEHLNLLDKEDTQKILDAIRTLLNAKSSMELDTLNSTTLNIDFLSNIKPKNELEKRYIKLYQIHIALLKEHMPSYIDLVNRLVKEDTIGSRFIVLFNTIKQENAISLQNLDTEYYFILFFSFFTLIIIIYYILSSEKERLKILQLQSDYKKSITTDLLTGLKNRSAYINAINNSENVIVILFDITDFTSINNLYGFKIGDFILKELGQKLDSEIQYINNTDIFRVGSDQFAIVLNDYSIEEADIIAKNLMEVIERLEFKYDNLEQPIFIQTQIGISNIKPYLLNAALAINSITDDYSKKIAFYNDSLDKTQEIQKNITMIQKIKHALIFDEVAMLFQPLIDLKTKDVIKHEALVRLKDKDEYVSPYFFLELSKKAKLYNQITHEVISKSIQAVIDKDVDISINLSIEDILHKETYDFILRTLENNSNIAAKLTFELLETEEINDFNALKEFIKKVKAFGVSIAIDDFGSGYSNYNYLLELDVDIIKIDGSLIKNIDKSENNQLVVRSIIEFAKLANIKTVAEFVASQEIEKVVTELGVDYGQGFYYSAPKLL